MDPSCSINIQIVFASVLSNNVHQPWPLARKCVFYLHSTKYVFAVSFFILYVHKRLPPIKSCLACIHWSWLPWVTAFNDPRELLFTAGEQVFTALIILISANLTAMRWVVVHHLGAGDPSF